MARIRFFCRHVRFTLLHRRLTLFLVATITVLLLFPAGAAAASGGMPWTWENPLPPSNHLHGARSLPHVSSTQFAR